MKKLIVISALLSLVAAGCASKENKGGSYQSTPSYGTGTSDMNSIPDATQPGNNTQSDNQGKGGSELKNGNTSGAGSATTPGGATSGTGSGDIQNPNPSDPNSPQTTPPSGAGQTPDQGAGAGSLDQGQSQ